MTMRPNREHGQARSRRRPNLRQIYERAASKRRREWQQTQRLERSVTVKIARKFRSIPESRIPQPALCHEFNLRVARREATFEEWATFVRDLSHKFNRFLWLRFNPIMLHQVENLVILGRFTYGDERLRPVLSELGIFVKIYLDENGAHNIVQLNTQLREGPLPADDPVFHFVPYRHGSLEDITQRVGLMPSIPLEIASTLDDRLCSICYYEFAAEGDSSSDSWLPMQLPCKHSFHSACITPWLAQNPSCPICRDKTFTDL